MGDRISVGCSAIVPVHTVHPVGSGLRIQPPLVSKFLQLPFEMIDGLAYPVLLASSAVRCLYIRDSLSISRFSFSMLHVCLCIRRRQHDVYAYLPVSSFVCPFRTAAPYRLSVGDSELYEITYTQAVGRFQRLSALA